MAPALVIETLRVLPHEQIVGPCRVVDRICTRRPSDMSLAAAIKFMDIALAAPRAGDQQQEPEFLMRYRRSAMLVDQSAGRETIKRKRCI